MDGQCIDKASSEGWKHTEEDLEQLRERTKRMFYHAYDNYMLHAFPHDELRPLSCHYQVWMSPAVM